MTTTVISPEVRSRWQQTIQVIRDSLPAEKAEAPLDRFGRVILSSLGSTADCEPTGRLREWYRF